MADFAQRFRQAGLMIRQIYIRHWARRFIIHGAVISAINSSDGRAGECCQRFGLRSGKGTLGRVLAISAARAAALSSGGGGPDSLLAKALRIEAGMLCSLIGCGSKPPAESTVLHSCGSFAMVGDLRGLLGPAGGCAVPTIAALFSLANQSVSSWPQPSPPLTGF